MTLRPPSPAAEPASRRSRFRGLGSLGTGAIAVVWILTLSRAAPIMRGDYGVFVSVAERLLAGDRLYVDVWDNKDPFFFYALALGRSVTPFAGALLEVTGLVTASIAVSVIGYRLGVAGPAALFAGLGMTPLILTGSSYLAGYTHLPGTALALVAAAFVIARRAIPTGIVLATLTFTKLVLLPVAIVIVTVALVVGRRRKESLHAAAAYVLGVGAIAAAMALRGELVAYLEALAENLTYSQSALLETDWGPFLGHVLLVVDRAGQTTLATVTVLLLAALVWHRAGVPIPTTSDRRILWGATAGATLAGIVVIGFTGFWSHHGQALYAGAALAGVVAAAGFTTLAPTRSPASIGALLAVALLLAGGPSVVDQVHQSREALSALRTTAEPPPSSEAIRRMEPSGEYARIGGGDDGHAFGLGEWDLACPRFHQYFFQTTAQLGPVLACARETDVLLVAPDARRVAGWPDWNAYIADVERLLATGYTCERGDFGRVCVRR